MSKYCVLSIKRYHSFSQIDGQQKHNDREIPLPNVDVEKSVYNKVLFSQGGLDYTKAFNEIVNKAKLKYGQVWQRSNSVKALEIVTSFSPEMKDKINIKDWCEANVKWMKETFGENNIIACTLHMDEETPHIHTEIVPIDDKGHFNAKKITGGKLQMMQLHSSYSKAMEPLGLVRGEQYSKSKKTDLNKFYKSVNDAINAKLPEKEENESIDDYLYRLKDFNQTMQLAVVKLAKEKERIKNVIDTRIKNMFFKYREAIGLYHDIFSIYGNEEKVNKKLRQYRYMQLVIPEDDLNTVLQNIKNKYPSDQSLNYAFLSKKQKEKILGSFADGDKDDNNDGFKDVE